MLEKKIFFYLKEKQAILCKRFGLSGIFLLIILLTPFVKGYALSAEDIIARIDYNQDFHTQYFKARMIIEKGGRKLLKSFYGYGYKMGEKSFLEFDNPEDRGVKYLKLKQELWIYFPEADDILKISGHMLKRGMMGSDISYQDMLETEKLLDLYQAMLLPDAERDGKKYFQVELKAIKESASYARQLVYVDKKHFVPVYIEQYAQGGRLLKKIEQKDLRLIQGKYLPWQVTIRDMRRSDSRTTVIFDKMVFNVKLNPKYFYKSNLRR